MPRSVSLDDVLAAADRIRSHVVRTPASESRTLSAMTGAKVYVKFENLQFTASYKERGALNRLLLLPPQVPGVVAASAGNFAQAVAYHATRLDYASVIVMPENTPWVKASRTEVLGAEVIMSGDTFEAASAAATDLALERGFELLSPFDDPAVIAGQGTVALEVMEDVADLDTIVVPVGGGGLLAGMAVAARAIQPGIELVGVQSERFPAVYNAFYDAHEPIGGATIAEGIAVAVPGTSTLQLIRSLADRIEEVSEALIEEAVGLYLELEKSVAEGAGAAALAELLARPERYRDRTVCVILSGGNIDMRQLASVVMRDLVRTGRLTTFWVGVSDQPGQLGRVTSEIGRLGGNILELEHRRLDPRMHARMTDVQLTVETSGPEHLNAILAGLTSLGHQVTTDRTSQRTVESPSTESSPLDSP